MLRYSRGAAINTLVSCHWPASGRFFLLSSRYWILTPPLTPPLQGRGAAAALPATGSTQNLAGLFFESAGGDVLEDGHETEKGLRRRLMLVEVVLQGLTVGALAGGNEEGGKEEGLGIVGRRLKVVEGLLHLGDILTLTNGIAQQGGVEELQGKEVEGHGRIVEAEDLQHALMGVEQQAVFLPKEVILLTADTLSEHPDDGVLDIADEGGAEHIVDTAANDFELVGGDVGELHEELVVEGGNANGEMGAAAVVNDLEHSADHATELPALHPDLDGGGYVVAVLAKAELILVMGDDGVQLRHVVVGHAEVVATIAITEGKPIEVVAVPRLIDETMQGKGGGLDEDIVMEIAAQAVVQLCLVEALMPASAPDGLVLVRRSVGGSDPFGIDLTEMEIGDDIIELLEMAFGKLPVNLPQLFVYPLGLRVEHDKPVFYPLIICLRFKHIVSFPPQCEGLLVFTPMGCHASMPCRGWCPESGCPQLPRPCMQPCLSGRSRHKLRCKVTQYL